MTAATAPVAEVVGLTKEYGRQRVVDDLSFSVRRGGVTGFLGPNGAGKTTTIRMLVGLIKPTRGRVTICDYDIRREFSPYVGAQVRRSFGATRRYLRDEGDKPTEWSLLTGVRFWF